MDDLRAQLEALRAKVRAIEARKYQPPPPGEIIPGAEVETEFGRHFEMELLTQRHGGFHLSRVEELPLDALAALSGGALASSDPRRWVFLDTETTGVVGGAGTVAFLVGIGRIVDRGFLVRQYFMRDFDEEASLLAALTRELRDCDVLITYNGKTYDQPLLESRYILARQRPPFSRLEHLDLLHGARRLWKWRFESCRLVELENRILGFERFEDVGGAAIPQLYFDYLRTRRISRMKGVFHHNALDILSLACLTAVVPQRFGKDGGATLGHAGEMIGLGRWLHKEGRRDEAITLLERALKRLEYDRLPPERRLDTLLTLAKHYEHKMQDYPRALEMTLQALELSSKDEIHRRAARLQRKIDQRALLNE